MLISADWLPSFHLSVAGLPHSSVGDHRVDAHVTRSRIPLIGPAHRVAPPVAVLIAWCWVC